MCEELNKIIFILDKLEKQSKNKIFSQDELAEQRGYLNEISDLEPELIGLLEEIKQNPSDLKIGDKIFHKYYAISYGAYLEETRALVMKLSINYCEELLPLDQNGTKVFDTKLIGQEFEKLSSLIQRLEQANKHELLSKSETEIIREHITGLKEPEQVCAAYLKSITESDIANPEKREEILEFLEDKLSKDYVSLYWLTAIIANVVSKIEKLRTTKK